MLTILLVLSVLQVFNVGAAGQAVQPKAEQPNPEELAIAGAKFGITFYKGLGAAYRAGEAERAYVSAQRNSLLQGDLTSLADAYKGKRDEARATANFSNSAGGVFITGAVGVGLVSGVGTVPTALFVAGAAYANKQVSTGLREAGEARAMNFLNQAVTNWQSTSGITYEGVRAKLMAGDVTGATSDFDKATGMLSRLRDQLKDDDDAARVAQNFVLETMRTTDKALLAQTARNTAVMGTVEKDLAGQVKFTRAFATQTVAALDKYAGQLEQTDKAITSASQHIQALEQAQAVTGQQVRIIEDVLYQQQSPATKIYMLQNNYRPELTSVQRQQIITYFQAQKQKEELIAESANVVNAARQVQGILSNLGIHDPVINKAVEVSSVAQKALSAALTGNWLGAISAITSLFGGGVDPEAERFAQIMGYLQQMNQTLNKIVDLQIKTLQAIQALSNQVADMDKRLNQRLDRIDFEVKVISENLRSVMWSSYLPCNTAWQDRTVRGTVSFDEDSLTFASSQDAAAYVGENEGKAIDCATKLDQLFLSIKANNIFGPLLSLKTAASTSFTILPAEAASALTKSDLERFLNDLYLPTVGLVDSAWDPAWGNKATLLAMLGDPASDLRSLEQKLDALKKAKAEGKPFHACSTPTVLSYRLRSLLCADKRYAGIDVPTAVSNSGEISASQQTAAYMGDPLVRDQLPWLAQWTGLAARPYDFWTGSGNTSFTLHELLTGKGVARGQDLIWSLLSVLDVGVAQEAVLHGDITAKTVCDLVWDKTAHKPMEEQAGLKQNQNIAIKLLLNPNNPWLGKNVLLVALRDSLLVQGDGVDPSVPYEKAYSIFNSVKDANQATSDEEKKKIQDENQKVTQEADFFLRGIFSLADSIRFVVEDKDDGFGGRIRKVSLVSGSYKLEMPTPTEFAHLQLSYPRSLISLLRLREVLVDRLVDYQVVRDISDPGQQKRVAALLFSGLAQTDTQHVGH